MTRKHFCLAALTSLSMTPYASNAMLEDDWSFLNEYNPRENFMHMVVVPRDESPLTMQEQPEVLTMRQDQPGPSRLLAVMQHREDDDDEEEIDGYCSKLGSIVTTATLAVGVLYCMLITP